MRITNQLGDESKLGASVLDIPNLSDRDVLVAENEHEFMELITAFIHYMAEEFSKK